MKGVNGFTFFKNYYDAITDPDTGTAEDTHYHDAVGDERPRT